MKMRTAALLSVLALLALLIPAPGAWAQTAAPDYCQWVCVDGSCRLEQSAGAVCPDPAVLQVASDPDAAACLPEPVTLDMVTNSDSTALNTSDSSGFAAPPASEPQGPTQPGPAPAPPQGPAPAPAPAKQEVLLTGFCDFMGIKNPTQRILPDLEKAIVAKCGADIKLTSQCLDVKMPAIQSCKVDKKIVISLGVDDKATSFRVETAAVNCFVDWKKDPSGKWVSCKPVCVDTNKPITSSAEAPGPWPTIDKDTKIDTFPVVKGDPPKPDGTPGTTGDYVCNATLYWLCTQKECKPYFIHTPQFGADKDKNIIDGLAKLICDIVAANKPK